MENFEEILRKDLHQFLLSMKEVDERLPECPDVEEKWEEIAKAYIPDGIREFQDFPSASLGWMMYIGMAVAKMWDTEWEIYSKIEDLYADIRDMKRLYIERFYLNRADNEYPMTVYIFGKCFFSFTHTLSSPADHTRTDSAAADAPDGFFRIASAARPQYPARVGSLETG